MGRSQRRYHGNPLAYYLSHPKKFQSYESRYELAVGDSGMYRALLRSGQIGEVFPETNELLIRAGRKGGKRDDLSEDEILEVLGVYKTSGRNANEAARNLHHSPATILRNWRNAGFELRERGGQRDLIKTLLILAILWILKI